MNGRTTPRDDRDAEVPRRRWGRALVWLGVIVVLVVVAIVASIVVHPSSQDAVAQAPVDTDVFCQTAARFRSFDELDLSSGGADQLDGLSVVATQLGTLSPAPITRDFQAVSSALQNVSDAVKAIPPDAANGLAVATQKLDDELGAVQSQSDEAAAYIERWCGPFDSLGTAPSTVPGPVGGDVGPDAGVTQPSDDPAPGVTQPSG